MKRLGSKFELIRRAAIDAAIGMAVFTVLAFGVTIDRTGGTGEFQQLPRLVSTNAYAMDDGRAPTSGARRVDFISPAYAAPMVNDDQLRFDMAFARTDQTTAMLLLGLMFSIAVAFKLAFLRHLRAVYSPARRGRAHRW